VFLTATDLDGLPRYETIREGLLRLLDWNKNFARLKRIISSLPLPESASPGDIGTF
jgi:hypothetical protein